MKWKELGDNKGMKENPMMKHALTKANRFEWVHFGEYVEGTPTYCTSNCKNQKSQKTLKNKMMTMMKKKQAKVKKNDVNEDIIEEPLKNSAPIDPTKKNRNIESSNFV
jgi:hypothetical protein